MRMSRVFGTSVRTRDEGGAVAVIIAVSMMALMMAGALVINFGMARQDRVSNKIYTDAAVAAGIGVSATATVSAGPSPALARRSPM